MASNDLPGNEDDASDNPSSEHESEDPIQDVIHVAQSPSNQDPQESSAGESENDAKSTKRLGERESARSVKLESSDDDSRPIRTTRSGTTALRRSTRTTRGTTQEESSDEDELSEELSDPDSEPEAQSDVDEDEFEIAQSSDEEETVAAKTKRGKKEFQASARVAGRSKAFKGRRREEDDNGVVSSEDGEMQDNAGAGRQASRRRGESSYIDRLLPKLEELKEHATSGLNLDRQDLADLVSSLAAVTVAFESDMEGVASLTIPRSGELLNQLGTTFYRLAQSPSFDDGGRQIIAVDLVKRLDSLAKRFNSRQASEDAMDVDDSELNEKLEAFCWTVRTAVNTFLAKIEQRDAAMANAQSAVEGDVPQAPAAAGVGAGRAINEGSGKKTKNRTRNTRSAADNDAADDLFRRRMLTHGRGSGSDALADLKSAYEKYKKGKLSSQELTSALCEMTKTQRRKHNSPLRREAINTIEQVLITQNKSLLDYSENLMALVLAVNITNKEHLNALKELITFGVDIGWLPSKMKEACDDLIFSQKTGKVVPKAYKYHPEKYDSELENHAAIETVDGLKQAYNNGLRGAGLRVALCAVSRKQCSQSRQRKGINDVEGVLRKNEKSLDWYEGKLLQLCQEAKIDGTDALTGLRKLIYTGIDCGILPSDMQDEAFNLVCSTIEKRVIARPSGVTKYVRTMQPKDSDFWKITLDDVKDAYKKHKEGKLSGQELTSALCKLVKKQAYDKGHYSVIETTIFLNTQNKSLLDFSGNLMALVLAVNVTHKEHLYALRKVITLGVQIGWLPAQMNEECDNLVFSKKTGKVVPKAYKFRPEKYNPELEAYAAIETVDALKKAYEEGLRGDGLRVALCAVSRKQWVKDSKKGINSVEDVLIKKGRMLDWYEGKLLQLCQEAKINKPDSWGGLRKLIYTGVNCKILPSGMKDELGDLNFSTEKKRVIPRPAGARQQGGSKRAPAPTDSEIEISDRDVESSEAEMSDSASSAGSTDSSDDDAVMDTSQSRLGAEALRRSTRTTRRPTQSETPSEAVDVDISDATSSAESTNSADLDSDRDDSQSESASSVDDHDEETTGKQSGDDDAPEPSARRKAARFYYLGEDASNPFRETLLEMERRADGAEVVLGAVRPGVLTPGQGQDRLWPWTSPNNSGHVEERYQDDKDPKKVHDDVRIGNPRIRGASLWLLRDYYAARRFGKDPNDGYAALDDAQQAEVAEWIQALAENALAHVVSLRQGKALYEGVLEPAPATPLGIPGISNEPSLRQGVRVSPAMAGREPTLLRRQFLAPITGAVRTKREVDNMKWLHQMDRARHLVEVGKTQATQDKKSELLLMDGQNLMATAGAALKFNPATGALEYDWGRLTAFLADVEFDLVDKRGEPHVRQLAFGAGEDDHLQAGGLILTCQGDQAPHFANRHYLRPYMRRHPERMGDWMRTFRDSLLDLRNPRSGAPRQAPTEHRFAGFLPWMVDAENRRKPGLCAETFDDIESLGERLAAAKGPVDLRGVLDIGMDETHFVAFNLRKDKSGRVNLQIIDSTERVDYLDRLESVLCPNRRDKITQFQLRTQKADFGCSLFALSALSKMGEMDGGRWRLKKTFDDCLALRAADKYLPTARGKAATRSRQKIQVIRDCDHLLEMGLFKHAQDDRVLRKLTARNAGWAPLLKRLKRRKLLIKSRHRRPETRRFASASIEEEGVKFMNRAIREHERQQDMREQSLVEEFRLTRTAEAILAIEAQTDKCVSAEAIIAYQEARDLEPEYARRLRKLTTAPKQALAKQAQALRDELPAGLRAPEPLPVQIDEEAARVKQETLLATHDVVVVRSAAADRDAPEAMDIDAPAVPVKEEPDTPIKREPVDEAAPARWPDWDAVAAAYAERRRARRFVTEDHRHESFLQCAQAFFADAKRRQLPVDLAPEALAIEMRRWWASEDAAPFRTRRPSPLFALNNVAETLHDGRRFEVERGAATVGWPDWDAVAAAYDIRRAQAVFGATEDHRHDSFGHCAKAFFANARDHAPVNLGPQALAGAMKTWWESADAARFHDHIPRPDAALNNVARMLHPGYRVLAHQGIAERVLTPRQEEAIDDAYAEHQAHRRQLGEPSLGYRDHIRVAFRVLLETLRSESPFDALAQQLRDAGAAKPAIEARLLQALEADPTFQAKKPSQAQLRMVMRDLIRMRADDGLSTAAERLPRRAKRPAPAVPPTQESKRARR